MGVQGTWAKLYCYVCYLQPNRDTGWSMQSCLSLCSTQAAIFQSCFVTVAGPEEGTACSCWLGLCLQKRDSGQSWYQTKAVPKNIEAITSFSCYWEETKVNSSSYRRKRELKRYAARYLWGRVAETEEQTAGGRLVRASGVQSPDSQDSQLPSWQKCTLRGMATLSPHHVTGSLALFVEYEALSCVCAHASAQAGSVRHKVGGRLQTPCESIQRRTGLIQRKA